MYIWIVAAAMGLGCLSGATGAQAQTASNFPAYTPAQQVHGVIRSWGHGFLKTMMKKWEAGFQVYQPGVTFEDTLVSSAAAMAGLYSGRADIGVLAREITPPEIAAYEKMTGQPIFGVDVLTGSYGNPDKIMTLGVFVNKANPVDKLTFKQLDAIFGSERRRGEKDLIRTWDQLGLRGDWAGKLIKPNTGLAFEAPGYFFSQTVMGGSVLWNCNLHQFADVAVPGEKDLDGYKFVVDAVGNDKYGIAIAGAGYKNANVKLVALAKDDGSPYVMPSPASVANRTYPLVRPVRFYIHHGGKLTTNPLVLEFMRFILSREGQALVESEGDFFPTTPASARVELGRLQPQ